MTTLVSLIILGSLAALIVFVAIYYERHNRKAIAVESSDIYRYKTVESLGDLNSIPTPVHGDMVYVTSEKSIYIYNNTWILVSTYYEENF